MRDGMQIDIALRTEGGPGCEERHIAASRRKTILCKSRKLPCQVRKAHALSNLDNRTVEGAVDAIYLDSPWPGYRRFEHDAIAKEPIADEMRQGSKHRPPDRRAGHNRPIVHHNLLLCDTEFDTLAGLSQ